VRDNGGPDTIDGVKLVKFRGGRTIPDRLLQMFRIYAKARSTKADAYHCNEFDSWMVGIALKLTTGAKLVFDAHEIASHDLAESRFPPALRPLVIGFIRALIVPMSYLTDRLVLAKISVVIDFPKSSAPKQILVRNYVETSEAEKSAGHVCSPGHCVVLHLGAINRARGWPQMLDAIALTQEKTITLRVIGRFGDNTEEAFLARVRELGLNDRVQFQSWIPYDEVIAATQACDIGLIAFQPVMLSFTHALPHKLFDYMLADLPVVVPDFSVEVAEIVSSSKCGLLVDVTSPKEMAAAFDSLAADPARRDALGRKGHDAVISRYNWEQEAATLVAMYRSLSATIPSRVHA
jgi:glycosyltransferase involved in cell wall biosynthesis